MYDSCPYCYRAFNTWKNDPILLPHGAKYDWTDDTHLVYVPDEEDRWYKGFQQIKEDDIIELQDALKTLEEDNGITPLTEFSSVNDSGKFQITGQHIKEMRDSVEKLLIAFGLTKTDYFNYDEEGNHIIHPNGDKTEWTDPITEATDLQKFQVKYIHIEDLRHYIQILMWQETWTGTSFTYTLDTILPHSSETWSGIIEADNTWNFGILNWNRLTTGGRITSTLSFNSNCSFDGYAQITGVQDIEYHPTGIVLSQSGSQLTWLPAEWNEITENLHFQVDSGFYSESGSVIGAGGPLPSPSKPAIVIFFKTYAYEPGGERFLTYIVGDNPIIGPWGGYSNIIYWDSTSLDRNLYDDFKSFYPTFAAGAHISWFGIEFWCYASGYDNKMAPPNHVWWLQTNSMSAGLGIMRLKRVHV